MPLSEFDGEYWNTDTNTSTISRLQFVHRRDGVYVYAWDHCFPTDCERGETELHLLREDHDSAAESLAFATWQGDDGQSHCLLKIVDDLLSVIEIRIRAEFHSYVRTSTFRQGLNKPDGDQDPDPLSKLKHLWDGSESGWKLIQYDTDVFLIEFCFDESGPTREDIPAIVEFVGTFPHESTDQMWERMRGCSGIVKATPLGQNGMKRLQALQRRCNMQVTFLTIGPDDYLVLSPSGHHYQWSYFHRYRRSVIQRMLKAGVAVVTGHLD